MKSQIIDTIESYETIIIHRHVRPDPDAYGSQVGLKTLIQTNYPEKNVYAAGTHDELLSYLTTQDEVTQTTYQNALVIITDTGNTERIDGEFYKEGAFVLKIDHHPDVDQYGDLRWVDPTASSTSEMIFALFEEGSASRGWKMSDETARLLFAGIVGDTGRFMFPSTTEKTFDAARKLIRHSFDRPQLFAGMYEVEREILHLQGFIYQNFVIDENGAAYIKIDNKTLKQFEVTASETSQLVGSLGEVKGIKAWVIFIEEEDQIRARLRSKGPVINGLAARFGGGGHPLASGASVSTWEEADHLIGEIQKLCKTN
ncbi:bifunctional oligoribonuclease/PAP phosphatase NrnA [Sporosarcina sp. HYO08]|uniref:DHH family phosphoesterase n=1 Tax=Sporosarcina sp. HYO08 TaxID=1759557 RepID=UPI00079C562F|nr:bifunctional oligoribonuclease/PAP phosphatase NrnA [Sporosarcina sp. HYO08]KXH87189.1 oligoribonuclease [Sporosarcina sp. HYO08]